jgi:hypothetical protein
MTQLPPRRHDSERAVVETITDTGKVKVKPKHKLVVKEAHEEEVESQMKASRELKSRRNLETNTLKRAHTPAAEPGPELNTG